MNRLLLIGNGFDLAHALRTDYNDFILWYLKSAYEVADLNQRFEDKLILIERVSPSPVEYGFVKGTSELIHYFYCRNIGVLLHNQRFIIDEFGEVESPFQTVIKNQFVATLLTTCSNKNWVDIENEFYKALKDIMQTSSNKPKAIAELNESMASLVYYLEKYLSNIKEYPNRTHYLNLFKEEIIRDEILLTDIGKDRSPQFVHALNFNYTDTVKRYDFEGMTINHIHGELKNRSNPLIFGFGDEIDKDYEAIENQTTKGFLTYIKSFGYFKTRNYHDLVRFIDSDIFQVYVVGHSCGLSDRTMLNMIFEHEKCVSIKIFYHQRSDNSNNFTEITQEISRHFRNKASMRNKIVDFERSHPMPQIGR